ncbi:MULTISPECIES: DUF6107 family protein [unclassified Rhizobium]|uniref:DUF6107 family protein n=1 Tax=unclassified Rhizobium TaxID=2613769 RepID=UPI0006FA396C|nr:MULTISPECIES: DUF6107 family protein [unclassified Rhizobium]KQV43521.1 hypothetical protein ASC86_01525 [Rhizobium sp. Root1212]KRD37706.1 hypothetical protein ASE37_01525 [Rhizobium sp. Root268]
MADIGNDPGLWAANALGAVAGAAVSLVYMLPRSRQEAASRFLTGTACGLIFGAPTGVWLVGWLGIAGEISGSEMLLTGSAAASLCAWWVLGAAARIAARFGRPGG